MGCCGSKVDDLHLVTLCRERKELIKAAIDHRYELAAAHALYFQSLTTVGEALCKFVEEVVSGADSDSTPSLGSPVLTLPSHHRKPQKSSDKYKGSSTSTSTSVYYTDSHRLDDKADGSHLHLSSGSDSQSDLSSDSGHIHIHESPISKAPMGSDPYPNTSPSTSLGFSYPYPNPSPQSNPHSEARAYYMKKSSVLMKSVIYEEPERYSVRENERWSAYGDGGYSGYQTGEPPGNERAQKEQPPSAPPSPPNVSSAWDYLNVFQTYDDAYPGYNLKNSYGVGSITSSPDSKEVRELEGIPDLEDETEKESVKSRYKKRGTAMGGRKNFREGRSRAVPSKKNGGASAVLPSPKSEASTEMTSVDNDSMHFTTDKEINSSTSEIIMSKSSSSQGYTGTAVSFEVDEGATVDAESSNPTSLTMLPPHGTRDLQEVIREIKGEFETASGYGKEVAVLLEVGKVPYRSKDTVLKGRIHAPSPG
ncbi:hypothetical protein SAY86_003462 [Trapa natans]|uniref:DUF630 domain-containing protein n=1 Tax=Trapa natans TaxID=22666 RepID=A0AAN7RHY8_TRANT|nr:hypothetical protein SAY86_003462 [Trapa natans]